MGDQDIGGLGNGHQEKKGGEVEWSALWTFGYGKKQSS
jgi:hypothetical protein